ncbi:uncharacterized protein LOC113280574 [Papaver somniferum]|uniref:uncharacterized protein LOC113280574 n=1 Tax=Papaver somniferum TaxID=3469 RepID=UPI000E705039|nr:uncharacterized protein LOC113280574 [Papaver somniferum]
METMEDQPPPVDVIHEDTKDHFQTDLTWKTKEEVVKWVEEHAWKFNCVLVKGRQSKKERVEMVCERGGKKVSKKKKDMDCRHNHPRPKDLHGHYRAGRLKAHEYAEVDKMTRARMAPSKILSKLKADDKNNKTTLQQIYNARSTLRRKDLQGRLVMQQLLWLARKKNYACQKKLDEFGHVTHFFIAHPECVKLALCFPQVLILDFTYKTNKYEIPLMNVVGHTSTKSPFTVVFCFLHDELKESYVWALEQVKLIFREDALPKVMVTDQEAALMKKFQGIIQPLKLKELEKIVTLRDGEREVKKKEFRKAYEDNERMCACFHNDWEALTWSITEEVYEENVAKLIANWGVKYPEIIIYLRKQFLGTNAHRFVSAFKNHHKHFDNQATSMIESVHYRLNRNLFGCVDTFFTVFDAMEDYFMRDVIRIGTLFEKSLMMKHDEFPDDKWLQVLTHRVSHLCIELIMKEVELMEKMDANSQEECVCKMRESMGLPCRHELLRYKDCLIPFEDIDPHWKQLSNDHMPDEDDDVEIWDTPYGKRLAEMYRGMLRPQKQILWDNMMPILYPNTQQGIFEPEKGPQKGRPPTKENRKEQRERAYGLTIKKPTPTTRDPCGSSTMMQSTKKRKRQ